MKTEKMKVTFIAVTEWMADDTINFMAKEGRGLICAPLDTSIAKG